jgi:hypothetical protein
MLPMFPEIKLHEEEIVGPNAKLMYTVGSKR